MAASVKDTVFGWRRSRPVMGLIVSPHRPGVLIFIFLVTRHGLRSYEQYDRVSWLKKKKKSCPVGVGYTNPLADHASRAERFIINCYNFNGLSVCFIRI